MSFSVTGRIVYHVRSANLINPHVSETAYGDAIDYIIEDAAGRWWAYGEDDAGATQINFNPFTGERAPTLRNDTRDGLMNGAFGNSECCSGTGFQADGETPCSCALGRYRVLPDVPEPCDHHWIDATNSVVSNAKLCLKCGTIESATTAELASLNYKEPTT